MAKQLNVSVAVTADTSQAKAQLQNLQNTLQQLSTNSANLKIGVDPSQIQRASLAVTELQAHLKAATNVDTGTLNFAKLDASIRSSGQTLQNYGNQLLKLGPSGQQAFSQLASAVAQSEIPVKKLSGLFGEFGTVLKNTVRWQAASSIIHGMMGSIQHAYSYAQQLNESLNRIQIVTQASSDHMAKFAEQANKAAKQLSTTTTAYTDASLIYYQQGLSDKEVAARTEVTIKMANAAGVSAQTVSDQLTAVWNNFADGSKSLEYYADVMTALGAATASSTSEISKGLEKFAAVADTVGLSYENASAALATITATTRQSADTVGTGLRTLFSRLQSVSLGETLDDGVTLTKYSKALNAIGVSILDQQGNLRDMDAILEDMGSKWQTLSKAQQVALAQTVGGVRQYTTLISLMDNWDFYKQNQQVALTSEGTVQRQQEVYEKSWKASQDRVKASAESIYSTLINDQFFIDFNNGFSAALDTIKTVIDSLGGLKGVLSSIGLVASTVFSDQITASIYKFGQGIKNIFTPQSVLQNRRNSFLENAATSAMGLQTDADGNVIGGTTWGNTTNQFRRDMFASQLNLQNQYANQQGRMTPLERAIAEQQLGQFNTVRETYETALAKQQSAIINSVDKRGSVVAQGQSLGNTLLKTRWADMTAEQKAETRRFAQNGWFDSSGKTTTLSPKYYKELGQSLTEFRKPIEDFTKIDSRFQEFFKTGTQDIEAFKKALKSDGAEDTLLDQIDETMSSGDIEEVWSKYKADFANLQEGQITDVAQQFGVNPETLQNYVTALREEGEAAQTTKEFEAQLRQEREKSQQVLNKQNRQMQVASALQKTGTALMGLSSTISTTDSLIDTFEQISEGTMEASEGTTSLISSFSSLALTATMLYSSLGPVGLVIAGLGAAFSYLKSQGYVDNFLDTINPDRVTKREYESVQSATEISKNVAQSAKEAQESFSADISNYDELINSTEQLSAGTLEYALAIEQAHESLLELVNTYGDLLNLNTDFSLNKNGTYSLTDEASERLQKEMAKRTTDAQARSMFAQVYQEQYENLRAQGELARAENAVEYYKNKLEDNEKVSQADYDKALEGEYKAGTKESFNLKVGGADFLRDLASLVPFFGDALYDKAEKNYQDSRVNYDLEALSNATNEIEAAEKQITYNNKLTAQQYQAILTNQAAYNDIVGENGEEITAAEQYAASFLGEQYYKTTSNGKQFYSDEQQERIGQYRYTDENGEAVIREISKLTGDDLINAYRNSIGEFQRDLFLDSKGNLDENAIRVQLKAANEQKIAAENYNEVIKAFNESEGVKALANLEGQDLATILSQADYIISGYKQDQTYNYAHGPEDQVDLDEYGNYVATQTKDQISSIVSGIDTVLGENFNFSDWFDNNKNSLNLTDLLNSQSIVKGLDTLFNSEVTDKIGSLLFKENDGLNKSLLEGLSSIDTSSRINSLFGVKGLINISPTAIRNDLQTLYDDMFTAMGGKTGVFSEIFKTEDFQKELKDVQKEFKKTGKISSKNIENIADACEVLDDALDNNILSAGAVADALELYSEGAIDSIDSITEELWNALDAANAFSDALEGAFDWIDSFNPDRSITDIDEFFSKTAKDYFSELGSGTTGSNRLYQEAAALFNQEYANQLKSFFYMQEGQINQNNPWARQAAYDAKFGEFDAMWEQVQNSGNLQPFWQFMLSGKGNELYGRDVSGSLTGLGLKTGTNPEDIEWNMPSGMTSDEAVRGLMSALGIDEGAAQAYFSEIAGHSAAIATDFQVNDFLNGAGYLLDENGNIDIERMRQYAQARSNDLSPELIAQSLANQYGIELDENGNLPAGGLGDAMAQAKQAQLERRAQELGIDVNGAANEGQSWDDWLKNQTQLSEEQQKELDRLHRQAEAVEASKEQYNQLGEELETQKEVKEDLAAADQILFDENGNIISGLKEGTAAYERVSDAAQKATIKQGEFVDQQDTDKLISQYKAMGMTAEQAFQTAKDAADKSGKQMTHSWTDRWGNVQQAVIKNANTAQEYLEKCSEAEAEAAEKSNKLFGKQLFSGMIEGLQELGEIDLSDSASGILKSITSLAEAVSSFDGSPEKAQALKDSIAAFDGIKETTIPEGLATNISDLIGAIKKATGTSSSATELKTALETLKEALATSIEGTIISSAITNAMNTLIGALDSVDNATNDINTRAERLEQALERLKKAMDEYTAAGGTTESKQPNWDTVDAISERWGGQEPQPKPSSSIEQDNTPTEVTIANADEVGQATADATMPIDTNAQTVYHKGNNKVSTDVSNADNQKITNTLHSTNEDLNLDRLENIGAYQDQKAKQEVTIDDSSIASFGKTISENIQEKKQSSEGKEESQQPKTSNSEQQKSSQYEAGIKNVNVKASATVTDVDASKVEPVPVESEANIEEADQDTSIEITAEPNTETLDAALAEPGEKETILNKQSEEIDNYLAEHGSKIVDLYVGKNGPQEAIAALPKSHALAITVSVSVSGANGFGASTNFAGGGEVLGSTLSNEIDRLATHYATNHPRMQAFIKETELHYQKKADGTGYGSAGTRAVGGQIYSSYVNGSVNRYARAGISLTAEEGPEIVWNKQQGYAYIVGGEGHPEFAYLQPGDRIFNANDTRQILNYNRPKSNYNSAVKDPREMDDTLFSSHAGGSAYGSYGPQSSYGNKSGRAAGGKGGSSKEFKPERYHLITRQIQDLTFWYEELKKARENAYGVNVLRSIDKEIAATDELVKANRALLDEVDEYLTQDLAKLNELGINAEFDSAGNILNFEELEEKYKKKADEEKDEEAQKAWDAITQYEETLDKMQEVRAEISDQLYDYAELRLEKIKVKAEMRIDFDDREIKFVQHFLDKIDDDIYKSAEAFTLMGKQMGLINDKIVTTHQSIDDIFANMVDRYGNKINITYEQWLNMSAAEREALDINGNYGKQLEENADDILEYIESLQEYKKKGVEKLTAAFDELNEKVNSQVELLSHYSGLLSSIRDIADLQGIRLPKDFRNVITQLNNSMISVAKTTIKTQQEQYQSLAQTVDELTTKISNTTDEALKKDYQKKKEDIEKQMRDLMSSTLSTYQDALNTAKSMFDSTMEWIKEDYGATMSDIFDSTTLLQDAFDRRKTINEQYVDDYEKYYQLGKLERSIMKDLDQAAANGNKQNKNLKLLLEDIHKLQQDGTELSAYDLDILAKRYEYEKALADLEDARNAKQTVRLQRDRNGNWGYVYTAADGDELAEQEQAVEDKLYEYTKAATERSHDLESEILKLWTEAGDKVAQMWLDGASPEAIADVIDYYKQRADYLTTSIKIAADDAGVVLDRWQALTNDKFNLTTDTFGESILSMLTGISTAGDVSTKIISAISDLSGATELAIQDYNLNIKMLNELVSGNSSNFSELASKWSKMIEDASAKVSTNAKEAMNELNRVFTEILKQASDFEEMFMSTYEPIIKRNEEFLDSLIKALAELNKVQYNTAPENNPALAGNNWSPASFDTGGFTGSWGPDGKLAFLHEQEEVFNKHDTANLLQAANILRTLDMQTGNFERGLGDFFNPSVKDNNQIFEQNVNITAEFPNATDHSEIEEAFNNLANRATQYANRKVG